MDDRRHAVFAFYHLLTWYAAPMAFKRMGKEDQDIEAFIVGFLLSLALYKKVGKKYIDGY